MSEYDNELEIIANDNQNALGFYNDINKSQLKILNQFKEVLLKEKHLENFDTYHDLYLLRFLRARKFDIEKAKLMITNFFNWRVKEKVEEAEFYTFPEIYEAKKLYPHGYHKTDKIGRPLYVELIGVIKLDELFKITTKERLMKYYIREYERLMKYRFNACSKAVGRPIEQGFTILDLNGVSLGIISGDVKNFVKIATSVGQDYYPEMLGNMFMVNSSFIFSTIYAMFKGFIDEKTRKKIVVIGSKYKEELLKFVDVENLPEFLGGTCTCKHIPGGCLFADIGPWNPEGGIKD